MADIAEFSQMNEIYLEAFGESKPARTTFQVGKLPIGARYIFSFENISLKIYYIVIIYFLKNRIELEVIAMME